MMGPNVATGLFMPPNPPLKRVRMLTGLARMTGLLGARSARLVATRPGQNAWVTAGKLRRECGDVDLTSTVPASCANNLGTTTQALVPKASWRVRARSETSTINFGAVHRAVAGMEKKSWGQKPGALG